MHHIAPLHPSLMANGLFTKHVTASLASAELLTICREHDLPIKDAFAPLETMATWCALQVDTKKLAALNTNSADFCEKLGNVVFNNKSCMLINRILLIGDDVDIHSFDNIMWSGRPRV